MPVIVLLLLRRYTVSIVFKLRKNSSILSNVSSPGLFYNQNNLQEKYKDVPALPQNNIVLTFHESYIISPPSSYFLYTPSTFYSKFKAAFCSTEWLFKKLKRISTGTPYASNPIPRMQSVTRHLLFVVDLELYYFRADGARSERV